MIKNFKTVAAVVLATVACCCTNQGTPDQKLADARVEYDNFDYGRCQKICDDIMADSVLFDKLNVRQLCTLAELYTLVDAAVNNKPTSMAGINDANAARCLGRARELNPDSVDIFLSEAPAESAVRLNVLNRVSTYLTIPRDSLAVEDEIHCDSI